MFLLLKIKQKGYDIYSYSIYILQLFIQNYYLKMATKDNRKRVRYDMGANIEYDHIIYDHIVPNAHDTHDTNDTLILNDINVDTNKVNISTKKSLDEWTFCQLNKCINNYDYDPIQNNDYFIGCGIIIDLEE